MSPPEDDATALSNDGSLLPPERCRVMGLNQNFSSRSRTPYHVQVEDRGPVYDDVGEQWVRRVNVIAYANYGEPTARIVHGRDHDFPDVRTREHNLLISRRIPELAAEARGILERREDRLVARLKAQLERYSRARDEQAKREIEEANALYPFVFARAYHELKAGRAAGAPPAPRETVYPLDPALRDLVLEIERVSEELGRDLAALRARGAADDILQATCAKLVARARESLTRYDTSSEFAARYLEMTRNSLVTAYRQVRARLSRLGG